MKQIKLSGGKNSISVEVSANNWAFMLLVEKKISGPFKFSCGFSAYGSESEKQAPVESGFHKRPAKYFDNLLKRVQWESVERLSQVCEGCVIAIAARQNGGGVVRG